MPHTQRAFDWIEKNVDLLKKEARGRTSSLLYVGWRHDCKPWWHDWLVPAFSAKRIAVMEAHPPNAREIFERACGGRYPNVGVILGDARAADVHVAAGEYDVIFWDHGPEHVSMEELRTTTPALSQLARGILLYCAPWGEWPQGPAPDNALEEHRCVLGPAEMEELGMQCATVGSAGQAGEGEIIAWRRGTAK